MLVLLRERFAQRSPAAPQGVCCQPEAARRWHAAACRTPDARHRRSCPGTPALAGTLGWFVGLVHVQIIRVGHQLPVPRVLARSRNLPVRAPMVSMEALRKPPPLVQQVRQRRAGASACAKAACWLLWAQAVHGWCLGGAGRTSGRRQGTRACRRTAGTCMCPSGCTTCAPRSPQTSTLPARRACQEPCAPEGRLVPGLMPHAARCRCADPQRGWCDSRSVRHCCGAKHPRPTRMSSTPGSSC